MSRTAILQRVRAALGREAAATGDEADAARNRALGSGPAPRPEWPESTRERFTARFEAAAGTWTQVPDLRAVGPAVQAYLEDKGAPPRVSIADHPDLASVEWPSELEVIRGGPAAEALAAVSVATVGLAETGSLVLLSGADNPTALSFLPDYHLVVLHSDAIVPWFEDVWERMRDREGFPPRSFNYVTGPSRTADVEQTLQLGAHGPRSLHLILVDDTQD